ncbi:MAG TPA: amidohydrolase family protein [Vicinamibacterales bacterium]
MSCCLAMATAFPGAQPAPQTIALVGGLVLTSPAAEPLEDGAVVIERGRVASVGPRSRVAVPEGTRTIDCRSLVVVAGFQNSHVHFTEPHWADAEAQPPAQLGAQVRDMLTSRGFTTVADIGSMLSNTLAIRKRIEAGEVPGPRILTAGTPLYPPDGVPFYLKDGSIPPDLLKMLPQPASPQEATRTVARTLENGADLIKLFTGSWVAPGKVKPMPVEVAAAAAGEAHRRRAIVIAHTSSATGLEVTLSSGVDIIAHALDDMRGLTKEHLQRMKAANVALIPTLTLFADAAHAPEILQQVGDYVNLGGDILFGTDVGYHKTYDTRPEFELMGKAGLNWQQILASLTTVPARRFGEQHRRGELVPGMDGDVVVLGSDPRQDVGAFADVRYTIRGGAIIYERSSQP